jgi:hypothetical protein
MPPLLTLGYWFALAPVPFSPMVERALLVVFTVFFVAGIVVWVMELRAGFSKFMKRALARAATLLGWSGLVGLLLWSFSYERIPLLSMRFFYILWLGWVVAGAWFIFRYGRTTARTSGT